MRFYKFKKLLRAADQGLIPDKEWSALCRERLLSGVRASRVWQEAALADTDKKAGLAAVFTDLLRFRPISLRPVFAVVAAVAIVASGSIATVSAARASLPGDVLYPVKIGLEKAQITLTASPQKKAELAMANALTRIKEVKEIIKKDKTSGQSTPDSAARITEAINRFNDNINGLQKQLEEVREADGAGEAAAVSKLVNDKTAALASNLSDIQEGLDRAGAAAQGAAAIAPGNFTAAATTTAASLDKARELTEEANVKSLGVIVSNAVNSGNSALKQEARALLQTNVAQMEKKIDQAAEKISSTSPAVVKEAMGAMQKTPEDAKRTLSEAKKILDRENTADPAQLNEALSKVSESKSILKEVDKTLRDLNVIIK